MLELFLCIVVVCIVGAAFFMLKAPTIQTIDEFDDITDNERLLINLVPEIHQYDMLLYARTLELTPELQSFILDKKEILDSISWFMLAKVAEHDAEKRQKWSNNRFAQTHEDYKTKAIKKSLSRHKQFK